MSKTSLHPVQHNFSPILFVLYSDRIRSLSPEFLFSISLIAGWGAAAIAPAQDLGSSPTPTEYILQQFTHHNVPQLLLFTTEYITLPLPLRVLSPDSRFMKMRALIMQCLYFSHCYHNKINTSRRLSLSTAHIRPSSKIFALHLTATPMKFHYYSIHFSICLKEEHSS